MKSISTAKTLDLEQSALEHSEYEGSVWKKGGRLDRITRFIRTFINQSDQGLVDYIAAWGIYYARKSHYIAVTLNDNFQDDPSTIQMAEKCNGICAQYTEIQQLEYDEFLLQNDLETAIEKYIIEYREADSSNTVEENPQTKYNRPNSGNTSVFSSSVNKIRPHITLFLEHQ